MFHPQQLVVFFRLAFVAFSTGAYTSILEDFEAIESSKLGDIWSTQDETKKQPRTERLHFTCGQLARNQRSPNSGMLLMGCVRVLGAPDSGRRLPETTHEVFSWTRSCEPAFFFEIAKHFISRAGALVLWLRHR